MKLSYLWRGLPGHPLHPPLTDATIGTLIAFVHGMRVLKLKDEPAGRAVSPIPHAEREEAEGG
jgi:hypothetical protein